LKLQAIAFVANLWSATDIQKAKMVRIFENSLLKQKTRYQLLATVIGELPAKFAIEFSTPKDTFMQ